MDNFQSNKAQIRIQKRIRRSRLKEAIELYTENIFADTCNNVAVDMHSFFLFV